MEFCLKILIIFILLFAISLHHIQVLFGCLHSCFTCASSNPYPYSEYTGARSHRTAVLAKAHGAANTVPKEAKMPIEKCQRTDFGFYKATELRQLAGVYRFAENSPSRNIHEGGLLSCNFDSSDEKCAWYTISLKKSTTGRSEVFRRARFESFFDLDKFDCTSERSFPFDDYFLLIGGREDSLTEVSAALEVQIPCQMEKSMLKFDYWSNNETPNLKVCVIAEKNPVMQCEESRMDSNPLTFEIPQNPNPFRLRIQVDNIVGRDDIVFIDNLRYVGQLCENKQSLEVQETTTTIPLTSITEDFKLPTLIEANEDLVNNRDSNDMEVDQDIPFNQQQKPAKNTAKNTFLSDHSSACKSLTCDFNYGDSCYYYLSGLGSTSAWKVGGGHVGNPHTGIHRFNPKDMKSNGFAYVGSDFADFSEEVFVMESPKFSLNEPAYLSFDLYLRSVGPQLKICINTFDLCLYSNPDRLNVTKYWFTDERVFLNRDAEKVYFIAGKVRENLFLAIDNIRLLRMDLGEYCDRDVTKALL